MPRGSQVGDRIHLERDCITLFVFVIVIFIDSRCESDEISWGTKLPSVDVVHFIVDGVQGSS